MIEAQRMTPSQLFDNADAYVLGLLEDSERDAFEAGLVAASPSTQRQVREHMLRTSLGIQDTLLPDEEPAQSMRFRVLTTIREAMVGQPQDAGRAWWSSTSFWRAACLGFATAAVTLGAFAFAMQRQHDGLERSIQASIASAESQKLGPVFARVMLADNRQEADLNRVSTLDLGPRAAARLFVEPISGSAVLCAFEMPVQEGKYRVELRNEDGSIVELATFIGTPGLSPVTLPKLDINRGGTLVVVGPAAPDRPATDLFSITLA